MTTHRARAYERLKLTRNHSRNRPVDPEYANVLDRIRQRLQVELNLRKKGLA